MQRIKVISRPPGGGAPEKVRDAWIGLELPTLGRGEHHGISGYRVDAETAFNSLKEHDLLVHTWWMRSRMMVFTECIFAESCCELIA